LELGIRVRFGFWDSMEAELARVLLVDEELAIVSCIFLMINLSLGVVVVSYIRINLYP
jgi:hypothetical protein